MAIKLTKEEILKYHLGGKIEVSLLKRLSTDRDLSIAYTPGVAQVCREIMNQPDCIWDYTSKNNSVAVATDGTAVLGLGNIGAEASIPVMEGKCVLFRTFAKINAWPICLNFRKNGRSDIEKFVEHLKAEASLYGGINLEDIAADECFEIENRLDEELGIPVFHDDQWGTAVISLAAVINYCEVTDKKLDEIKVVINGAGAAGIRIADLYKDAGIKDIVLCDSKGVLSKFRNDLNFQKQRHSVNTNKKTLGEVIKGADVFVGVSVKGVLTKEMVQSMNKSPGIFAMANPDPEILPEEVKEVRKDAIVGTGRSDYPNQINNVLGFPFIFRGALDVRADTINLKMKRAASRALADLAKKKVPEYVLKAYSLDRLEFGKDYLIPKPFDKRLLVEVPYAVAAAAIETGVAKLKINLDEYKKHLKKAR